MPARMNAYWSLRTNTTSSGNGSGDSATPMSFAAASSVALSVECSTPIGTTSLLGASSTGMSRLMFATRPSAGTVGWVANHSAPSRPFSSAVSATNSIERFGAGDSAFSVRAASSRMATPSALSSAPL